MLVLKMLHSVETIAVDNKKIVPETEISEKIFGKSLRAAGL